jgi:hypothetical protein
LRTYIAAVKEAVNIDVFNAFFFRKLSRVRINGDVAVHSAVRQQSEQVEVCAFFFRVLHRVKECFVLFEFSFANGNVHARQALVHDPSCADIQVADFRVPHLAFWKTYRFA